GSRGPQEGLLRDAWVSEGVVAPGCPRMAQEALRGDRSSDCGEATEDRSEDRGEQVRPSSSGGASAAAEGVLQLVRGEQYEEARSRARGAGTPEVRDRTPLQRWKRQGQQADHELRPERPRLSDAEHRV